MHAGQRKVLQSNARFKVVACGRRWGKTLLAVSVAYKTALRGGQVWWVAPDYPRAKIGWRRMMIFARQIPGCSVKLADKTIFTPGGGSIELMSAHNPDSLRGEGIHLVVIDECADVPEIAWTDGLSPTLMDYLGSALFIGTPKGRNWFHRLWLNAIEEEDWEAFRMPSHTNPTLSRKELARQERNLARAGSSRTWRQEILAEFVTFAGRVYETFDPGGPMVFDDLDQSRYVEYFGGIDFGYRNPCAIVVAGQTADGELDVIDEHYESRMSPEDIKGHVRRLHDRYDVRQWWGDAADPQMIDVLRAEDLPVDPSPRTSGGQDSWVQYEVRLASGRLEEDPPSLRFYRPNTPNCIREHDGYRYPETREGTPEREKPLKVDDHTCNAVQFVCHGIDEWGGTGGHALFGDDLEAWNLPT